MLELVIELNQQVKTALVVVTHDMDIAAKMGHQWLMQDGRLDLEN